MSRIFSFFKTLLSLLLIICFLFSVTQESLADESWICMNCGTENHGKFCSECGLEKGHWICPECNHNNSGKFCVECGYKWIGNESSETIATATPNADTEDDDQIITYDDDSLYIGQIKNGKRNGEGSMYYNNGDLYIGGWKDDKQSGQGTYTWASGAFYIGEWKNGNMNGHGSRYYDNGDYYEGEWKDDYAEGFGKKIYADGIQYEGYWKNNRYNGHGKMTWPEGDIYDGDWVDGERTGYGIYTWPSGNTYEGEFLNGEIVEKDNNSTGNNSGSILSDSSDSDKKFNALLKQLEQNGEISPGGKTDKWGTIKDEWAQIGWYQWSIYENAKRFVLSARLSWDSASQTPNNFESGCGVIFNGSTTNNDHLLASLRMDGLIYFTGKRNGQDLSYGTYKYGSPSIKNTVDFALVIDNGRASVYIDGQRVVRKADLYVMGDSIGLCTLSGTNKDFGTRCNWEDIHVYTW